MQLHSDSEIGSLSVNTRHQWMYSSELGRIEKMGVEGDAKEFIPSEFSSQFPSQLVDLEWRLHISLNTSRQLSLLVSNGINRMKASSNPTITGLIFKMLGTETEIDGMSDDVGAKGVRYYFHVCEKGPWIILNVSDMMWDLFNPRWIQFVRELFRSREGSVWYLQRYANESGMRNLVTLK